MPSYKIEDVEGIGPVYGEKLRKAGIESVDQLLKIGLNSFLGVKKPRLRRY